MRFFVEFEADCAAAITPLQQLQDSQTSFRIDFPSELAVVIVFDRVSQELESGGKLHSGLVFRAELHEGSLEDAISRAERLSNIVASFLAAITATACSALTLIRAYGIDPETMAGQYIQPFSVSFDTKLRQVQEAALSEFFSGYSSLGPEDASRIRRALDLIRKGLAETNRIDAFLAFWMALELINKPLKLVFPRSAREGAKLRGVKRLFLERLQFTSECFDDLENLRDRILHGFLPLTQADLAPIAEGVTSLRRASVAGVAAVLNVTDSIASKVTSLDVVDLSPIEGAFRAVVEVGEHAGIERLDQHPFVKLTAVQARTEISGPDSVEVSFEANIDRDSYLNGTFRDARVVLFHAPGITTPTVSSSET